MTQIKNNVTALMKQVRQIKAKYPDAILWYRIGDYYQAFDEDADITSRHLETTLTRGTYHITGFPHHQLDVLLHKMVKLGYKIAICEQLEAPPAKKQSIKRKS